jgi:PAS domain S-box-containing protein
MKSERSLHSALAWQFAWVASLPLLVVGTLVWLWLLPQMRLDTAAGHQALARVLAGQVGEHLRGAEIQLQSVAQVVSAWQERDQALWIELLDAHAASGEVFEALYIADAGETVQAVGLPPTRRSGRTDLLGLDLSGREYLHAVRTQGKIVWSQTYLSTISSRLAVACAVPAAERIVIGEITLDQLSDFIRQLPVEAGLFTLILDRGGRVIADSERSLGGLRLDPATLPTGAGALAGQAAAFELGGRRLVGTMVGIDFLGWNVLVAQPAQLAFRQLRFTMQTLAAALALSLLLAALAGWRQSLKALRQFEGYAAQARAIAQGNYSQHWPAAGVREFTELAGHLHQMSQAICDREAALAESEARHRALFETMTHGVLYLNDTGCITAANPAAQTIFGLKVAQLAGMPVDALPWREVEADPPREPATASVLPALRGGAAVSDALLQVSRPGSRTAVWVNLNATARFEPGPRSREQQSYVIFEDITARRLAETGLREAQRIIHDSPAVAFLWRNTAGWPVEYVSENVVRLFGYSVQEMQSGAPAYADVIHPEDRARVADEVAAFSADASTAVFTHAPYRIRTKDGVVKWVDDRTTILRDRQGRITHYQGVVLDVSARQEAEQALRLSESNLRITLDSIGDAVISTDIDGIVTRLNPLAERLTGWSAAEAVGRPLVEIFHIVHAHTRHAAENPVARVVATGTIVGLANHTVLIARDGREYQIADSGAPIRQTDGRIVGVVLVFRDVSESYRQARRVEESEARLRNIMTNLPGVVFQLLVMPDGTYGTRFVSDKVREIFGLEGPSDEFFARFMAGIPSEQRPGLLNAIEHAVSRHAPWSYEGRYLRPDGETVWFSGTSIPHREGDTVIFDGLLLDVGERVRAQQALGEAHRMLRLVIDTIPERVFWKDRQSRYLGCNQAFARDAGFNSPEQLIGLDDFAMGWRDQAESYRSDDAQVMDEGVAKLDYEEPQTTPDGGTIWLKTCKVPMTDDQGRVLGLLGTYQDITVQKQAEIEGRRRRSFLESVLYHLPDAIVTLDARHRVIDWNPGAVAMFGYSPSEALGRDLDTLVARGAMLAEAAANTRRMLSGQRLEAIETIRTHKDGTPRHVIAAGSPIKDGDQLVGLVAVYTDISALKRVEQNLRDRETMLRRITDIVPSMIFVKNAEGRFLMANRAVACGLGMSVEQLTGRLHEEVYPHPEQVQRMLADDRRAMLSGEVLHIPEETFQDASGAIRWLETIKVPCPASDFGEPAIVGLSTDITERKRVEAELRSLRNYLTNIIDSMPSMLVGVDGAERVTQWNRQAEHLTGISAAAAQGQPLSEVLPGLPAPSAAIAEAIRSRRVHREEKIPRHGSGETRFEDLVIYPLITNGVEGAVIRIDDVTERVRLEEMMIQGEKMLSVGGLAAGMAHEINNPLAGIIQNAHVLHSRLLGDLPANHTAAAAGTSLPAIRGYLERRGVANLLANIRESGSRASAIVKNMLEFARKSDSTFSTHDLADLLDRTLELAASDYDLKKRYDFKRIDIVRDYDETLPAVPCERTKIQQVFLNILRNGAEAMAAMNHTRQPRFTLRTRSDGAMARIEIQDNGPGMVEATRKRIFEPFFTTKPVGKGTGLGLSVSYFIIAENHGGDMTVESTPEQGTCFIVRLPLRRGG